MSPIEQAPRIGAQDEMAGIDSSLYTTPVDKTKVTKPEDKKPTLQLGAISMAGMAINGFFRPDTPQRIAAASERKRKMEVLSRRDPAQVVVMGMAYPKAQLMDFLADIVKDFSVQINQKRTTLALTEYRMLPPALQKAVLQGILDAAGVNQDTGIPQKDKELRAFCVDAVALLKQSEPAFADKVTALLTTADPLQTLIAPVNQLQDSLQSLSQTMKDMFGGVSLRDALREMRTVAKDIGREDLVFAFNDLDTLYGDSEAALQKLTDRYARGMCSVEEFTESVNTIVLTLDQSVNNFTDQLQTLIPGAMDGTDATGNGVTQSLGAAPALTVSDAPLDKSATSTVGSIQTIGSARSVLQAVRSGKDTLNKKVADTVLDMYQSSQGKVVIKLDPEVYGLVNDSLQRLKDGGAAVTLLPAMFCNRQPGELLTKDMTDLLKGSYEIFNTQTLNNFSIAIRYLYEQVLQKDRLARSENREQLLKNSRDVDKFLDEMKAKVVEFNKRLTDVSQKARLEKVYTAITMYQQMVSALQTEAKAKGFGQEKSTVTVAWLKEALNTERWKQVTQTLMETTQAV